MEAADNTLKNSVETADHVLKISATTTEAILNSISQAIKPFK